MMRWLVGSSLRFSRVVVALVIALPLLGVVGLRSHPVDVYPEFAPPSVQIQAEALGLSAAEVEQLITVPLEQDLLNGVPWLDHVHSRSEPGLSAIDLVFEPGTDIYAARQMVQERLTQAHALPAVGSPPIMIEPLSATGRVAMIGLSSTDVSLIDLSVMARWRIRPKLMGIPGVANVAIYGQRDRQLQVQVDPAVLSRDGVTLTQVVETAGNALWVSPLTFVEASTPGTGGFVESPNQRLSIQHVLPITSPEELAQVPVEGAPPGTLRLGDVARVIEDHQQLIGDAQVDGRPSLVLVVQKFPDANPLAVTKAVEAAMQELAPGLAGITVDSSLYRPASFIQSALHNIGLAAVLGLLLLAVVLLGLQPWRAAVVSLIAIPASLLAAALALSLSRSAFTTMTLIGLATSLTVVVDNAIRDVHSIRLRARGFGSEPSERSMASVALEAVVSSQAALGYATAIILLATLPLLVLDSLTTAFTRPAVIAFATAVLVSMLVALTLTPTLAVVLLRDHPGERGRSPVLTWVQARLDRAGARLARPAALVVAVALAVVGTVAVIAQLRPHPLLPTLRDSDLLLTATAAPGTSLSEMNRVTAAMSAEIRQVAGVLDVGVHVGRAITSDQTVDVDSGELWIALDGRADPEGTQAKIRSVARGYPGLDTSLATYTSQQVAAVAAGSRDDLVVRVYGEDFAQLSSTAQEVLSAIRGVDGVSDAHVVPLVMRPTVQVEVDLAAAQRYGLRPGDVRRDATTLTSQLVVGNLYEQAKIFDVVVRGISATRASLTGVENLVLDTPSGAQVRLRDVATVRVVPQPTAISHDEVSRSMDVVASVRGRSASRVVADVRSRVANLTMPAEFHAQVLGSAADQQATLLRLLAAAAGVLVVVYLLLQAATASWRRAAVLLVLLPVACVGGVLVAPLAGGLRSLGVMAGLFCVLALATRELVAFGRRDNSRAAGAGPAAADAVGSAAREDGSVLMLTVLCAAAVVTPAAVLGGRPGLEVLQPFAVTVLGGLATVLMTVALVLPALLASTAIGRSVEPPTQPQPRADREGTRQ